MAESHPPAPGPFVEPNLESIERAVDRFTFPIAKADMLAEISDDEAVLLDGRNVELRTLVKDLHDDYFDSIDEFRDKVHTQHMGSVGELVGRVESRKSPIYANVTQDMENEGSKGA